MNIASAYQHVQLVVNQILITDINNFFKPTWYVVSCKYLTCGPLGLPTSRVSIEFPKVYTAVLFVSLLCEKLSGTDEENC